MVIDAIIQWVIDGITSIVSSFMPQYGPGEDPFAKTALSTIATTFADGINKSPVGIMVDGTIITAFIGFVTVAVIAFMAIRFASWVLRGN